MRYVVSASLHRSSPGYRLSDQLVDAVTGQVVSDRKLAGPAANGPVPEQPFVLLLFESIAHSIELIARDAELAKMAELKRGSGNHIASMAALRAQSVWVQSAGRNRRAKVFPLSMRGADAP